MDVPTWAALLGCFPSCGDSGIQLFLVFFFDATLFNIQGTVGRKMIMARAQLLIILLSLEMTHITSVHVPSAGVGEMEFLAGQVPPRSDSKIRKGSPDLQC